MRFMILLVDAFVAFVRGLETLISLLGGTGRRAPRQGAQASPVSYAQQPFATHQISYEPDRYIATSYDLNVPFEEKEEAKALGAQWDPEKKTWYVFAEEDLSRFARWWPQQPPAAPAKRSDPGALDAEESFGRVDLKVPFEEKDQAKALGARWDADARVWYAPPGADLDGLLPWIHLPQAKGETLLPPVSLLESRATCHQCKSILPVCTVVAMGYINPDEGDGPWIFGPYSVSFSYISWMPEEIAQAARKINAGYGRRSSKTMRASYYRNHCPCGFVLGDYFLHGELGYAFQPSTPEEAEKLTLYVVSATKPVALRGQSSYSMPDFIGKYARQLTLDHL